MLDKNYLREEVLNITFSLLEKKVSKDLIFKGLLLASVSEKGLEYYKKLNEASNNRQFEYFEDEILFHYKEDFEKTYLKNKIQQEIMTDKIDKLNQTVRELTKLIGGGY